MQYLNTSPPTGNEDEEGPKPTDERVVQHIPDLSDDELLETFGQYPYGPYTAELIKRYLEQRVELESLDGLLGEIAKKYPKIWEEFAP